MLLRKTFLTLAGAFALGGAPLTAWCADAAPTPAPPPSAGEKTFVDSVSADLGSRFATIDAARAAGYIRYTDEDETGAISYANRKWTSDAKHPSQLWYDAKGRLIGADFSVPYAAERPMLFGVSPSRWQRFGAHVHYALAGAGGMNVFGATGAKTLSKVDGSVDHPTAKDLVAAGIAKSRDDVRFVFPFPAIWDLSVWLIPNPNGAFADANPDVKPSKPTPMKM